MNHKIIRIELTPLHVPFKEVVRKAKGEGALGMAWISQPSRRCMTLRRIIEAVLSLELLFINN